MLEIYYLPSAYVEASKWIFPLLIETLYTKSICTCNGNNWIQHKPRQVNCASIVPIQSNFSEKVTFSTELGRWITEYIQNFSKIPVNRNSPSWKKHAGFTKMLINSFHNLISVYEICSPEQTLRNSFWKHFTGRGYWVHLQLVEDDQEKYISA